MEGNVRDYLGERFQGAPPDGSDPSAEVVNAAAPDDHGPRLLREGVDITPASEPDPALSLDRLLRLHLAAGDRGSVHVTMHGRCFGSMANLAARTTCVDGAGEASDVIVTPADSPVDAPLPLHQPTAFGAGLRCTAAPREETFANGISRHDDEVCLAGGAFVLGSKLLTGAGNIDDPAYPATPQRVAVIPPLRVDRNEVTVGRFRDAVDRGFVSPDISPVSNDAPLPKSSKDIAKLGTWSTAASGREEYPLIGISWNAARAFCIFQGGDLLTEATPRSGTSCSTSIPMRRFPVATPSRAPNARSNSSTACESKFFPTAKPNRARSVRESSTSMTPPSRRAQRSRSCRRPQGRKATGLESEFACCAPGRFNLECSIGRHSSKW